MMQKRSLLQNSGRDLNRRNVLMSWTRRGFRRSRALTPHPSIDPFGSETNAGNPALVFRTLQGPTNVMFVIVVQQISNHLLAKSKRRIVVDQHHASEFFNPRVIMQIELIANHGASSKANALTF